MAKRKDKKHNHISINGLKSCARCLVLVLAAFLLVANATFPVAAEATEQMDACAVTETLYRQREKMYLTSYIAPSEDWHPDWQVYKTEPIKKLAQSWSNVIPTDISGHDISYWREIYSGSDYLVELVPCDMEYSYGFHYNTEKDGSGRNIYRTYRLSSSTSVTGAYYDSVSGVVYYMGTVPQIYDFYVYYTTEYSLWKWGDWSAWSETEYVASDEVEVEIKESVTQYRHREMQYTESKTELDDSWTLYDTTTEWEHENFVYFYLAEDEEPNSSYCVHSKEFGYYTGSGSNTITYYKYKRCTSKTAYTLYHYKMWSDWSDWSYTPVEASDDIEVETKTAYNHTYKQTEIAPTCTEQGCTMFTCERCGDYYAEDYVDATGHDFAYGVCIACGYADETIWSYSVSNGNVTITGYKGAGENGNLIIPSKIEGYPVTQIAQSAFYNQTGLTSITIPDGVTTIGPSAFSGCTKVQTIHIPASVQKIGYAAFYNCKALTELAIPEGVTDILYSTFSGCTGLISVSIPDSVVRIGELAFDNCKSLTSITIPEGATTIGRAAFFGCISLEGIKIPQTVTSLGDSAFYGCKGLTSVTIPGSLTKIDKSTFYDCTKLEDVVMEDGINTIDGYAFYNCTALKTVTFSDSVTYIGSYAFYNCNALADVYFGGSQDQWDALALGSSNAPLLNANVHLGGPCAQGHTYDHDFDGDCNVCNEVRELDNTYKFENYRVVLDDPDTTHKNLRVEVYKLGEKTVADPTDEKVLRAIDAKYTTHWGAGNINKILITDAGNYVLLLKYNIGTGAAIKVPIQITVSADPKLIIDKNNKITALDDNAANINHRVVVYYLGDQTVEDIYDEAALQAIDTAPQTHWQKTRINRLTLARGGNYVLHLCYNEGVSNKITVAQQFTVSAIPTLSVNNNNILVAAEENSENQNHRVTVFYLGEGTVEDPFSETEVKAAAVSTKEYWGLSAINNAELAEGGNYVIHLYYNVGTSEKRTLALDVTLNERPTLSVREDNRLAVTYSDPAINNPRVYIYDIGDATVSDIYDEAALKAIATPTQVWGLSSILRTELTSGTYVIHLHYNVDASAKKTVALKVTI